MKNWQGGEGEYKSGFIELRLICYIVLIVFIGKLSYPGSKLLNRGKFYEESILFEMSLSRD